MKTFYIGPWDDSTGLEHYATTWILSADVEGKNIIYKEEKSEKNKESIDIEVPIPEGVVYYIKAKRHLRDEDGNEVEYDHWIGPEKVINDEVNISDVFVPKTYIKPPYFKDIKIDMDDELYNLKVELTEPEANVPVKELIFIVEDKHGNTLYYKRKTEDIKYIEVPTEYVDFNQIDFVKIKAFYKGIKGNLSPITFDYVDYKDQMFFIDGNLKNLNPFDENVFLVVNKPGYDVKLKRATLLTHNNVKVRDLKVVDNKFYIAANLLNPAEAYLVKLDLSITERKHHHTRDYIKYVTIKTNKLPDFSYFVSDVKFNKEFKLFDDKENLLKTNKLNITEESMLGYVPYINDDNELMFLFYNPETDDYEIAAKQSESIPSSNIFKIDFLYNNKLFIFYKDGINTRLRVFNYDRFSKKLTMIEDKKILSKTDPIYNNSFAIYKGKYYVFYTDENKLMAKTIDIKNLEINEIYSIKIDDDLKNIETLNANLITKNLVAILPKDKDAVFTYIYDLETGILNKGLSIPQELRNQYLIGHSLINGNVVYNVRAEHSDKKLFGVMDIHEKEFNYHRVDYEGDIKNYLIPTIRHRNGVIDKIIMEDNNAKILRYS